jgi:23S rRNA (adenine2503-C2)-methyltransferase
MLKSLQKLTSEHGLQISSRKITVSTVGFVGKIKKFADDITLPENASLKNVKLALSLHSTDNGIREAIIPTSVKNRLPDLYEELVYFYRKTKNKITYEYIYFEGLNDTKNDISRLEKLSRMIPSNINIIPFHPIDFKLGGPLDIYNNVEPVKTNSLLIEKINDFIDELRARDVVVNLRSSSGVDINAACGQLAVTENKKSSL